MRPADLNDVPQLVWDRLERGEGAWRTPVLASVAPCQSADARTVVLREADAAKAELTFFTDRRSRKRAQLAVAPAVCLVIFDAAADWQLRLYGDAFEDTNARRLDAWWAGLQEYQRAHYAADAASGILKAKGRENFAAFRVRLNRFHCLWLTPEGNQAAEFEREGAEWRGHPVRA